MPLSDDRLRSALDPLETAWPPRRPGSAVRDAAVLVPWFTRAGEDRILYTLRCRDLPAHGGEVSFPGGAREDDEDALACALRETREEIGIDGRAFTPLGTLPGRESIHGFAVRVFVARLAVPFSCRPDPSEVDSVLELSVEELRDEDRWEWRTLGAPPRARRIPFFAINGGVQLWGLTALLTRDLLARV